MDANTLEGRKATIEETMDSGEFFLSGIRTRVKNLQIKRDSLKSAFSALEAEERTLKLKHTKLKGLQLSQDLRHRQERDAMRAEVRSSEDLLLASKLDKAEKLKRLEVDLGSLKKRKGLLSHPSLS